MVSSKKWLQLDAFNGFMVLSPRFICDNGRFNLGKQKLDVV